MATAFEMLQELDMVMRELGPVLMKQDEDGNFMHQEIKLSVPAETIRQLIDELKSQRPQA